MIIVSQDKTEIINFNNVTRVFMDKIEDKSFCIGADTNSAESMVWQLGEYTTEERAKEVLQEIIEKYQEYASIQNGLGSVASVAILPKIYKMPEK